MCFPPSSVIIPPQAPPLLFPPTCSPPPLPPQAHSLEQHRLAGSGSMSMSSSDTSDTSLMGIAPLVTAASAPLPGGQPASAPFVGGQLAVEAVDDELEPALGVVVR